MIKKIQKFMNGRYGIDEFNNFLFKSYIIIILLNIFINNKLFLLLEFGIIFLMCYRCFSKNNYQRIKENKKYLELKKKLLKPFNYIKRNIQDKDYVYKKCSGCKTVLKLPIPIKKGIKHAKCPNCKKRLTILTFKQQKIEIIKKKA